MNRIIKFRGKCLHSDEWCFGSLVDYKDEEMEIQGFDVFREGFDTWSEISVDSDTVGQFTGLCDSNGKEIYEGDILGFKGKVIGWVKCDVCNYCYYSIVYVDNSMGINEWSLYGIVKDDYPEQIEVIGNIHDNPGLLKGGKK